MLVFQKGRIAVNNNIFGVVECAKENFTIDLFCSLLGIKDLNGGVFLKRITVADRCF